MKLEDILVRYLVVCFALIAFMSCNDDIETTLVSPQNAYEFKLMNKGLGGLYYSLNWKGTQIISESKLDIILSDSSLLCNELKFVRVENSSVDQNWTPVLGEHGLYQDYYNESKMYFTSANPVVKEFAVCVRAYNEGVAFRYEFDQKEELNVSSELSEFAFSSEPSVWVSINAQSSIDKYKLSNLSSVYERPLLAELNDTTYLALGEAALIDFARMKFEKVKNSSTTLVSSLSMGKNNEKPESIIIPAGPYKTPWRYIMAAASPAGILQNNSLVLNLNEPNQLKDVSWVKPGKVIREVTLTTQGGMACVDFATKHNLQYIEFDAGWYGNEYDDASDATTVTVDPKRSPGPLELQKVIDYAKSKGIGVILYVNRRALEKQLDEVLPLLKSWGG